MELIILGEIKDSKKEIEILSYDQTALMGLMLS